MIETTNIDKLFLELSQFTRAKTKKELKLENELKDCREFNDKAITLLLHTDNYFGEKITRSQMSSIVEETERW